MVRLKNKCNSPSISPLAVCRTLARMSASNWGNKTRNWSILLMLRLYRSCWSYVKRFVYETPHLRLFVANFLSLCPNFLRPKSISPFYQVPKFALVSSQNWLIWGRTKIKQTAISLKETETRWVVWGQGYCLCQTPRRIIASRLLIHIPEIKCQKRRE